MFQCPHDCFSETDATEDTIEEMDEEDMDSISKLVKQGLDVGSDFFTDRYFWDQLSCKLLSYTDWQCYNLLSYTDW